MTPRLQPCFRRPSLPGQPEVEDLQHAVLGDEQVLGFQIAVDDGFAVGRREAVCDLPPTGVVQTIGMPGYARRASAQLAAMSR